MANARMFKVDAVESRLATMESARADSVAARDEATAASSHAVSAAAMLNLGMADGRVGTSSALPSPTGSRGLYAVIDEGAIYEDTGSEWTFRGVLAQQSASSVAVAASRHGGPGAVLQIDGPRGGVFNWSASGVPDDVIVFAAANGYWHRQWDRALVSILWAGAAGDGVSDDSMAFDACLGALDAIGGGTLVLPGGATYRIAPVRTNFPNNVHVVAEGATVLCPDTSAGCCIRFRNSRGSSLRGGTWDGNWAGMGGAIQHDGQAGSQVCVAVELSTDLTISDAVIRHAVNDGLAGYSTTGLRVINCLVHDVGEHAYYVSFSDDATFRNCNALNWGRNTWDKASVAFKARTCGTVRVHGAVCRADPSASWLRLTEGSAELLEFRSVDVVGVDNVGYLTEELPDAGYNSLRLYDVGVVGNQTSSAFSMNAPHNCVMERCTFKAFDRVLLFRRTRSVEVANCQSGSGSVVAVSTEGGLTVDCEDVTIRDCTGFVALDGGLNSRFSGFRFLGNVPENNRLHAAGLYEDFEYLHPDVPFPFYLYHAAPVELSGWRVACDESMVRAAAEAVGDVTIRDCVMRGGYSLMRDTNAAALSWTILNCSLVGTRHLSHLNDDASVVRYGGVLRTSTSYDISRTEQGTLVQIVPNA